MKVNLEALWCWYISVGNSCILALILLIPNCNRQINDKCHVMNYLLWLVTFFFCFVLFLFLFFVFCFFVFLLYPNSESLTSKSKIFILIKNEMTHIMYCNCWTWPCCQQNSSLYPLYQPIIFAFLIAEPSWISTALYSVLSAQHQCFYLTWCGIETTWPPSRYFA